MLTDIKYGIEVLWCYKGSQKGEKSTKVMVFLHKIKQQNEV